MKTTFGQYLPSLFVIAIIFTLCNAFLSYINLTTLTNDTHWVAHSHEVTTSLEGIYAAIQETESAQRGYILTQNTSYLSIYHSAPHDLQTHLAALKNLIKNDSMQREQIRQLEHLVQKRLITLQHGITLIDQKGFENAQQYSLEGANQDEMPKIKSIILALEKNESAFLSFSAERSVKSTITTYITVTAASLLNIMFVIIAYMFIKRELEQRSKSEQRKNEFISMASHELKTPITSMGVFAHMLQKKIDKKRDGNASHYIKKIIEQISKQTNLVNDLLDLSKMQAGKIEFHKEHFDINVLVKETVENMQATTKNHKITIHGKIPKYIYADRERVSQVLVNFLSNAIKYSPNAKKIYVSLHLENLFVKVSVRDFGIGIEKKEQKRIFSRFIALKIKHILVWVLVCI